MGYVLAQAWLVVFVIMRTHLLCIVETVVHCDGSGVGKRVGVERGWVELLVYGEPGAY